MYHVCMYNHEILYTNTSIKYTNILRVEKKGRKKRIKTASSWKLAVKEQPHGSSKPTKTKLN